MKKIPLLIAILYAIPVHAAVYNIVGTEYYVNGMPPNLTKTDKAMYLDRVNKDETDLALLENRATFIDTKSARQEVLKLKDVVVEPPPVSQTPTLDKVAFSGLFTATPQADRIKLETVLASLNAQTISDVELMINELTTEQKNTFKVNANVTLGATAQPSNAIETEALGNALAQLIIVAGKPPIEPPPVEPPPVEPPVVDPPTESPHDHGNMPMVDESKNMVPAVGFSELRLKPQTYAPAAAGGSSTGGDFRITCHASHMGVFDPIVYFGQTGVPHHHTFFGNTTTNPFSTTDKLKATGNSTCLGGIANRSAYWVPSLINTYTNAAIKPDWALFYYKGGDVQPPNGLVILAGDMSANPNKQQDLNVIDWQCHQPNGNATQEWQNRKNYIPACSGDLTATIQFPNCWNGVDLDSPNHKSHMAYHNGVSCPAGYPKQIPNITYAIHYSVNGTNGLRLSSDNYVGGNAGHSLHGDYMFAWDKDVLETWFANCNGADRDCHANLNGAGLEFY